MEYAQLMGILNELEKEFKFVSLIGEGLTSCVYRAFRSVGGQILGQPVAIKVLNSKNGVEFWEQEWIKLTKINGFHCVKVFDLRWIKQRPVIIMEYIEGLSLSQLLPLLNQNHSLILEILAQTQEALRELKKSDVVHGDLNLSNILIDKSGNIKLIDFGHLICDEYKILSPQFAADSLLNNSEVASFKTDLISLAKIYRFTAIQPKAEILQRLMIGQEILIKSLPKQKQLLANLVEAQFKSPISQTELIYTLPKSHWLKNFVAASLLLCLLVFTPCSPGTSQDLSFLTIVTKDWYHIKVNGQNLGYTPIISYSLIPGQYSLEWENKSRKGRRVIRIKAGERRLINQKQLR